MSFTEHGSQEFNHTRVSRTTSWAENVGNDLFKIQIAETRNQLHYNDEFLSVLASRLYAPIIANLYYAYVVCIYYNMCVSTNDMI